MCVVMEVVMEGGGLFTWSWVRLDVMMERMIDR